MDLNALVTEALRSVLAAGTLPAGQVQQLLSGTPVAVPPSQIAAPATNPPFMVHQPTDGNTPLSQPTGLINSTSHSLPSQPHSQALPAANPIPSYTQPQPNTQATNTQALPAANPIPSYTQPQPNTQATNVQALPVANPIPSYTPPQPNMQATSSTASTLPHTSSQPQPQPSGSAVDFEMPDVFSIPSAQPYQSIHMLSSLGPLGSSTHSSASSSLPPSSQGHPCAASVSAAGHNFLEALGISRQDSQRTNRGRVNHAQDSLPRKRRRGKAVSGPRLGLDWKGPSIDTCCAVAEGNIPVVSLNLYVYPPQLPLSLRKRDGYPTHLVYYTRNLSTWTNFLNSIGCFYEFTHIPRSTKVIDLLGHVATQLISKGWVFPQINTLQQTLAPHEVLPLQLLSFTNLGRANGNDRTPRLQPASIRADLTLDDLLSDSHYALPKLVVTERNRFVLNTIIRDRSPPLNTSLASVHLGADEVVRLHRCISRKLYAIFRSDIDCRTREISQVLEEEGYASCDEEEEQQEEHEVIQALTLLQNSHNPMPVVPVAAPASSHAMAPSTNPTNLAVSAPTSQFARMSNTPPSKLWKEGDWRPQCVDGVRRFFEFERKDFIFELTSETYTRGRIEAGYDTAHSNIPALHVRGANVDEMADNLRDQIKDAVCKKDFTTLLSPSRHFLMLRRDGLDAERYVSSGSGVEREAIFLALKRYAEKESRWYLPRIGGYSTLATFPYSSYVPVSHERQLGLAILGALVALCLIYGICPNPLNPLLLQYLINEGDVESLHERLVKSWFPELHATLSSWRALGPEDNISAFQSHFSTYYSDVQVASLVGRDQGLHDSLGVDMLQKAIVGPTSISHPDWQSFLSGFQLPTKYGFTFPQIICSYESGPAKYIEEAYHSQMISSYEDLEIDWQIFLPSDWKTAVGEALYPTAHLFESSPDALPTIPAIFKQFLEEDGLPCPQLMHSLKDRFHPSVSNLDDAANPGYRLRMFCWAATGAPLLIPGESKITIYFVTDDDPAYMNGQPESLRPECLKQGVCAFRTCSRCVYIPTSYYIKLLKDVYDEASEVKNAKFALHHWLMFNILDAIGAHTMK